MTIRYIVGDTRTETAHIPDGSVSLVASSPPFIALRSYLPADHPDKHAEIGSEPDPATFIDTLLELTAEWGRVLAPWGSIAIELGDTYAGSGGAGGDAGIGRTGRVGQDRDPQGFTGRSSHGAGGGAHWPRPKCLALVPQMYAGSLAYGRNLLTGQPSPAGQWLVRNMIVWHRPNPAVGALGDKYRPSRRTSSSPPDPRNAGSTSRRYGRNPKVAMPGPCSASPGQSWDIPASTTNPPAANQASHT